MDWLGLLIGAAAGYAWRGPVGAAVGAGVVAVIYRAGKAGAAAAPAAAPAPRRFSGAPVIVLQPPVSAARRDLVAVDRERPADQLERRLAELQR